MPSPLKVVWTCNAHGATRLKVVQAYNALVGAKLKVVQAYNAEKKRREEASESLYGLETQIIKEFPWVKQGKLNGSLNRPGWVHSAEKYKFAKAYKEIPNWAAWPQLSRVLFA